MSNQNSVLCELSRSVNLAAQSLRCTLFVPLEPSTAAAASTEKPVTRKWAKKEKGSKSAHQSASDLFAPGSQLSVSAIIVDVRSQPWLKVMVQNVSTAMHINVSLPTCIHNVY